MGDRRTSLPRKLSVLVLGLTAAACGSDEATHQPLRPGAGWHELLDWQNIPAFDANHYQMFSSYDHDERSQYPFLPAGNKDFNNFLAVCGNRRTLPYQVSQGSARCDEGIDGYLIAAADGPGYVSRLLVSLITLEQDSLVAQTLDHERVRVYADDLVTPLYNLTFAELKRGRSEPFVAPLAGWTSGAFTSYVPIEYRSKLRIYLDGLSLRGGYYHQIETRSVEHDERQRAPLPTTQAEAVGILRERARAGTDLEQWSSVNGEVAHSEALTLLDRTGAGTLRALTLRVPSADSARLGQLWLQASWDGRAQPAVRLPLSWLFGIRDALTSFDTLPMRVIAGSAWIELSLYLPMPFAQSARLQLVNESGAPLRIEAELAGSSGLPEGEWGHLHASAQGGREPFTEPSGFGVLELTGRGKYVGSVLFMSGRNDPSWAFSDAFNFLEGDPMLTVDGAESRGTGTEEYFDGGIYFREGPFASWFAGAPHVTEQGATQSGSVTLLRWNVLSNAIDFRSDFQIAWEYGLKNPDTLSEYTAVSFFYRE
jgi:hypothetical protein